jgi:hypothetical protein
VEEGLIQVLAKAGAALEARLDKLRDKEATIKKARILQRLAKIIKSA